VSLVEECIQEILKKSIEKVLVFSRSKQITIQYEAVPYLIHGNTPSLVEVFVILLDNAIKYSKPETTIEIAVKNVRSSLSILVKDHGIGIPTEDIPNIFDRFYRADTSRTKEQVKGYGLGLSIAKTIVKMHKGTIRVESVVDLGSTFIVQLPN
jgi:signal transduction histidine kinase